MKKATASTTPTPATQPRRRGRGAPLGNKNAVGNKGGHKNKGRARPAGAGTPNLKPGEKSKSLFVRLAGSDRARLEQLATERGQTMSECAREILLAFLDQ